MSKVLNNLLGSVYTVNNVPTAGAKALKYTTIGRFLYWLNDSFMLRDENGYMLHEFYVGKHDYECKPEDDKRKYENKTPFITFEHHFCTAIERFILPKLGQDRYKPFYIKYASDETLEQIILGDGTDILDILISLDYIQGKFEGIVTGVDETSINIYDFVKEILEDLQNDLGYINNFDIQLRDTHTYYVIDRNVTPSLKDIKDTVIDLVGLGSTVENINLSTSLTNDLATFSVISAAAIKSDIPIENSAMMSFNHGLQDRFIKEKFVAPKGKSRKKALQDKVLALMGYCFYVNKDLQRLPEISSTSLESSHKAVMTQLVRDETIERKVSPPSLLPITLSFDLLGISGVNVGEGFILEKGILPANYEGRVSFIVTSVSHKVENNRWTTTLDCLMTMIDIIDEPLEKRVGVKSILAGEDIALEINKLNEESADVVAVQSALINENVDDRTLFNVLAQRTVESKAIRDEFTPSWEGFRAANDKEKVINKGIEIVYKNQAKSRKGILNPTLIDFLTSAANRTNRKFASNQQITTIEVVSGGQISSNTLRQYDIKDPKSIDKVRYNSRSHTQNHDNGWAADIRLESKGGVAYTSTRGFKTAKPRGERTDPGTIYIVDVFLKNFFELVTTKGFAARIGVGSKAYMSLATNHVGLYTKASQAGRFASNFWGATKIGQSPTWNNLDNDFLKTVYREAKERYGDRNITLIERITKKA